MSVRVRIGWALMGVPWLSDASCARGFKKKNWHARLYFLGSRLASR